MAKTSHTHAGRYTVISTLPSTDRDLIGVSASSSLDDECPLLRAPSTSTSLATDILKRCVKPKFLNRTVHVK